MIIMSLILVLFQGARIGAVKMKTECTADIAMNSTLAEFNRKLYEQYERNHQAYFFKYFLCCY